MADVRCPMCSKANPEDAEVCEFCGARLKPLVADSGQEAQDEPSGGSGEEGVPDWLSRIRERAEQETPDEPQTPPVEGEAEDEDELDWLSRLRAAETPEEGPPEGDVPDWVDAESEPEAPQVEDDLATGSPLESDVGDQDDWLRELRQDTQMGAGEPEGEEPSEPESAEPESFAPEPPEPGVEDDIPLQELGGVDVNQEEEVEEEPASTPATGELPGWLSDTDVDFDSMEGPPEEEPAPEAEGEEPQGEPPDWFGEFERAGEEETGAEDAPDEPTPEPDLEVDVPEDQGDLPEWLSDVEPKAPEGEAPAPAFRDEEEEWEPEEPVLEEELPAEEPSETEPEPDAFQVEGDQLEPSESEPAEAAPAEPETSEPEPEWAGFDWDDVEGEVEEPEGAPESPSEIEDEEELPHVPALITGEEDGPRFEETEDFDLDAIELPDWLADAQAGDEERPEPAREGDLAPATIPSWLEAMRPVESFQPVVDVEPEEEDVVESVGPLAGLRGVLLAEPVVAKPRTATATGASLQVTERQYAQAELLQRIVEEEEHERTFARRDRRRRPWVRWLATVALLVAVLLPPLTGLPSFATPERVSRDLGPLVETVNTLPAERPVLVVFDYEPGYTAELEAVSGALLEHLFSRQVNVVTLSTRPTGPPLALDVVARAGEPHAAENGRDYLHLGYLSGGPTAVQLFAAAPRQSILEGFMLPQDLPGDSGWDAPVLRDVDQLQDFGMVAVVSSGTDNARTWAEQAHPYLGDTPLIMVLSAGAEPLIRPYFESLDPQVDGILTGLRSGVAYEQINGRPGPARARWDSFGAGVLAAELMLLAGTVYGLATWFLDRRRE